MAETAKRITVPSDYKPGLLYLSFTIGDKNVFVDRSSGNSTVAVLSDDEARAFADEGMKVEDAPKSAAEKDSDSPSSDAPKGKKK